MKYLILTLGLLFSAQASWASVVYSFATQPFGELAPLTFSLDESTFLNKTTFIPETDLENVSGIPKGFVLSSILITFVGPFVTVTENLNDGLPITFFFDNGPWDKIGTFDSIFDASEMTISDPAPGVPEPASFGLALICFTAIIGYRVTNSLRRVANSSRKFRS